MNFWVNHVLLPVVYKYDDVVIDLLVVEQSLEL
jgi:hypothetical protein